MVAAAADDERPDRVTGKPRFIDWSARPARDGENGAGRPQPTACRLAVDVDDRFS
jgi:hypothetical protein